MTGAVPFPTEFDDSQSADNFRRLLEDLNVRSGVAVIGAGLSSGAFPTWRELCVRLRQRAIAAGAPATSLPSTPVKTDPSRAFPRDFQILRDLLTPPVFLSELKALFGTVPPLPRSYQTLYAFDRLQWLTTFNYDEFLAMASAPSGTAVTVFPALSFDHDKRAYVYLHGRASTATAAADLVVTQDDYDAAYAPPSLLTALLKVRLVAHPFVFVGTSMLDAEFRHFLYGVRQVVKQLSDSGRWPKAQSHYAFLPAEGSAPRRRDFTAYLAQDGVKAIWFRLKEGTDKFENLDLLLRRLVLEASPVTASGKAEFDTLWLAATAQRLALLPAPTESTGRDALKALSGATARKAFFEANPGAGWFAWLRSNGLLAPDEPVEEGDGWRVEAWHAGQYLQVLCHGEKRTEVAAYLSELKTENWLAFDTLADLLERLPARERLTAAAQAHFWLRGEHPEWRRHTRLSWTLARTLNAAGRHRAPIRTWLPLFEALVSFYSSGLALDSGRTAELRDFELETLPALAKRSPRRIMCALLGWLALELEARWNTSTDDLSVLERRFIDQPSNFGRGNVDVVVEAILATCASLRNRSQYPSLVALLYSSDWPTSRRIALFEAAEDARALRAILPRLLESLVAELSNYSVRPELGVLLSSARLPTELQEAVASAIATNLLDEADAAFWRRHVFGALQPSMDREAFAQIGEVEVGNVMSPITFSEFVARARTLSPSGVLDLVRTPTNFGVKLSWHHESAQMWELLAEWADDDERLDVLLATTQADMQLQNAWRIVDVAVRLAAPSPERWRRLVAWRVRAIATEPAPLEAFLDALKKEVANGAPPWVCNTALDSATSILNTTTTALATPLQPGRVRRDDGAVELSTNYLNSLPGRAAETFVQVAFSALTSDSPSDGRAIPEWLATCLHRVVATEWGGVEMRVALGSLFDAISWADADLASKLADALLPEGQAWRARNARNAFWTGVLWRSRAPSWTLAVLLPYYRRELPFASDGFVENRLIDAFFKHLAIGAYRGLAGFEELLLEIVAASEEMRVRLAQACSVLATQDAMDDPSLRVRGILVSVLRAHFAVATPTEETFGNYAMILSRLGWLPPDVLLQLMLKLVSGHLSSRISFVLEFLDSQLDSAESALSTADVTAVLERLIAAAPVAHELRWTTIPISTVVEKLGHRELSSTPGLHALVQRLLELNLMSADEALDALRIGR